MDIQSLPIGNQPTAFQKPPHNDVSNGFSWLDEADDLDLRLALDDYHVELKSSKPATPNNLPSLFRRRLSSNKLSRGRPTASASRPATKDSFSTEQAPQVRGHTRRKSRALSLITPKNGLHDLQISAPFIDTAAAHYQDPEARHKLRAYLASPQKFDEALKFGFPANNACPPSRSGDASRKNSATSRDLPTEGSEKLETFLMDDNSSIYSDENSAPEPESPLTPLTPESHQSNLKQFQLPQNNPFPSKMPETFGQGPAAYREMTLRMTLTRPDLRSRDGEVYGWPADVVPSQAGRVSQSRSQAHPFQAAAPVLLSDNKDNTKESLDQIFADIDRELGTPSEGVVKRLWKRVRRF